MDDIVGAISELLTDKSTEIEVARLPFTPRFVKTRLEGLLRGWRVVVVIGASLTFLVLSINVSLLIWAEANFGGTLYEGVLSIYTGNCEYSSRAFLWSHLAINIAGSLLLACSNAACQCLTAPTREDIDRMHSEGHYLDVGIPSFRNLFRISWKKRLTWFLLVATSVPLHLVYNSVLFPTITANEYEVYFVTSDFLDQDSWSVPAYYASAPIGQKPVYTYPTSSSVYVSTYVSTAVAVRSVMATSTTPTPAATPFTTTTTTTITISQPETTPSAYGNITTKVYTSAQVTGTGYVYALSAVATDAVSALRVSAAKNELQRLENRECINAYSQQRLSEYRNVLVFTNDTSAASNNITIFGSTYGQPIDYSANAWPCLANLARNQFDYLPNDSSVASKHEQANVASTGCNPNNLDAGSWQIAKAFTKSDSNYGVISYADENPFAYVDYCLAEKTAPKCVVGLSRTIMISVIIANVIKLACFLSVLGWARDEPLVTVGDAISSFLRRPDKSTLGCGALSIMDVRRGKWPNPKQKVRKWKDTKRLWFRSVSIKRWVVTSLIMFILWGFSIFLCMLAISAAGTVKDAWNYGFGAINLQFVLPLNSNSLTAAVLLANTPQILISFCYVFFNNVLTSCLLAAEYADYALHRKPLRVTTGLRSQRSTYWLQLPYRYAVPLLITFTALHWMTSQSIFLARIKAYSFLGVDVVAGIYVYCGYSPIAVLFSTCVAGVLILSLYVNGFRRFGKGIPVVGSCSAAIAAACHAGVDEGQDMVEWPLQYGVLKGTGTRRKLFRRRTGFTEGDAETINDIRELKNKASKVSVRSVDGSSSGAGTRGTPSRTGSDIHLSKSVSPLPPLPEIKVFSLPPSPSGKVEAYENEKAELATASSSSSEEPRLRLRVGSISTHTKQAGPDLTSRDPEKREDESPYFLSLPSPLSKAASDNSPMLSPTPSWTSNMSETSLLSHHSLRRNSDVVLSPLPSPCQSPCPSVHSQSHLLPSDTPTDESTTQIRHQIKRKPLSDSLDTIDRKPMPSTTTTPIDTPETPTDPQPLFTRLYNFMISRGPAVSAANNAYLTQRTARRENLREYRREHRQENSRENSHGSRRPYLRSHFRCTNSFDSLDGVDPEKCVPRSPSFFNALLDEHAEALAEGLAEAAARAHARADANTNTNANVNVNVNANTAEDCEEEEEEEEYDEGIPIGSRLDPIISASYCVNERSERNMDRPVLRRGMNLSMYEDGGIQTYPRVGFSSLDVEPLVEGVAYR